MAATLRPPGPKSSGLFSNAQAFRSDPLGFLMSCTRDYGDIAYMKFGRQDIFLLNHPDLVKDVLVTHQRTFHKGHGRTRNKAVLGEGILASQDEDHHHQRRLVQPAFHRARIANYAAMMSAYSTRLGERWRPGETRDVEREMLRLSLTIIAKALFDVDIETEATELRDALDEMKSLPNQLLHRRTSPFVKLLDQLPLASNRRFLEARAHFDEAIYRIIAERRKSREDRGDMLSMLLNLGSSPDYGDEKGEERSDQQVHDEVISILLAGHGMIAQALTWSWYLLASNQEAEESFHLEVDAVLRGAVASLDDLPRLTYTRMMLSEAMRLYPPFWLYHRLAMAPYAVQNYSVPKGSGILISSYTLQRDARFFPDPNRFDPRRWAGQSGDKRPKFSYFPFGAGSRQCVGEPFAWMEGLIVMTTLAQRWRLSLVPDHAIEPYPGLMLRPRDGMRMTVSKRETGAGTPHL